MELELELKRGQTTSLSHRIERRWVAVNLIIISGEGRGNEPGGAGWPAGR